MGVSFSRSQTSGSSGMHTWPLPVEIMKLMISGVTFSAAQMKSPSFSRSSSSTTITTRPCRIASTAASTVENRTLMPDP
jgi:ABC-type Fe2+-enterobactin transport system substrate-binding protein